MEEKIFGHTFKHSDSAWARTYRFSLAWTWMFAENFDLFIQGDIDIFDKFSIAGESFKSGNFANLNSLLGIRYRF